MSVLCSKTDDIVLNSNNSLLLSVSSINYAGYKLDRCNVGRIAKKALQDVYSVRR